MAKGPPPEGVSYSAKAKTDLKSKPYLLISAANARKRTAKCAIAHEQADDKADAVLMSRYKKMIARHPCGTQSYSLPLLPSGPGGVRKSLLRRTRLSNRKISGGEGGIRTHGTLPHTRVPGVHLKPLGHLSSVFRANRHAGQWGTTLQHLLRLAKNKMVQIMRPHFTRKNSQLFQQDNEVTEEHDTTGASLPPNP